MRASIKWLRDYIEFTQTPEQLADMLTMAGVPVATVEHLGENIENVVTGKVIDIQQHPNADKLSICKIDVGGEVLTIVTGASNVRYENIVPVAKIGAHLPSGMKIKESKLRGEMSYGMLCSAGELNIDSKLIPPESRDGIYLLPPNTPIGKDIKEVLGLDDTVLEFELTANRADCFSMLGIAREIAVLTGGKVKKPMLSLREEDSEKTTNLASVVIEEPSLCSRFTGRVLKNVKVGPSPEWMKQRLQAAGMRSINNVVDVTNFIMLEMGQPMHAYDYNLLSKHQIVVRKAKNGEKLTTLDGVKRELTSDMLVIADALQPVGIAGVMGGLATEVTTNTQNIFLEAASFNGTSIRRTSRSLGLRSEASGRFERGVDTANIMKALDRAAKLLEDMDAGKVCTGTIDRYPGMSLPKQISFSPEQVNKYLGTNIEQPKMILILQQLEFDVQTTSETNHIMVTVPSWRGDVTCSADICEEIARIYGYNHIQSKTPHGNMVHGGQSKMQNMVDSIKTTLTGMGFDEVISFSFTHQQTLNKLNIPAQSPLATAIEVLNPITDDFPLLRTTLLGGIMDTIVRNLSRKNENLKIFEVGAVFLPEALPLSALPKEPLYLCGALVGNLHETAWNTGRDSVDFFDAKGAAEILLQSLGCKEYQVSIGQHHSLHPGKTACISKNEETIAIIGEVHPQVLDAFDINRKVYIFEVNLEVLASHTVAINKYKPLPKYPAITRDLALILPESVASLQVEQAIAHNAGPLLDEVRLFDVYTGGQVPQGCRSLAFSLTFRSQDRTLTDIEVDECHSRIVKHLTETLSAKLR